MLNKEKAEIVFVQLFFRSFCLPVCWEFVHVRLSFLCLRGPNQKRGFGYFKYLIMSVNEIYF